MSYFWTAIVSGTSSRRTPVERCRQVADAGRLRVVGVVGEDVEQPSARDLLALGHRGLEVGVAGRDDAQLWVEDQVETRRTLEQGAEVRRLPEARLHARK